MKFFQTYKKEDLFFCYSMQLFHYLKANGFYYLFKDVHQTSQKNYWVFERTQELHDALTHYSLNK